MTRSLFGFVLAVCLSSLPAAAVEEIAACGVLDQPGQTYVLVADIVDAVPVDGRCFAIVADDVTLDCQGHRVDALGDPDAVPSGVRVAGAARATVRYCFLSDWYWTINLEGTGNQDGHAVLSNLIHGGPRAAGAAGVRVSQSSGNRIESNYIQSNLYPERAEFGVLLLSGCDDNTIRDNQLLYGDIGIAFLLGGAGNRVEANTVTGHGRWGIRLDGGSLGNQFTRNRVEHSGAAGIILTANGEPPAFDNLIYDNVFNNMVNAVHEVVTDNRWSIAKTPGPNVVGNPLLGGNFWAKPDGTGCSQLCNDGDGDGLCDGPRLLGEDEDELPLARAVGQVGFDVICRQPPP